MLIGQQQPLTIAATVLNPATIKAVLGSRSYNLTGWRILDRWAFNDPQKLRALEAQDKDKFSLLSRLLEQQTTEHEVLTSEFSISQRQNGMTEHEILAASEIKTEL